MRQRFGIDIGIMTVLMTTKNTFDRPPSRMFTFVSMKEFQRRRIHSNRVAADQRSLQRTISRPLRLLVVSKKSDDHNRGVCGTILELCGVLMKFSS